MKQLTFSLIFLFSVSLYAQILPDRDVPEVVQKNFSKKFPRAENISWNKVDTNYKVDCYFRGKSTYAEYTAVGDWVQTVTEEDTKALYPPIERYLDENYKGDKIVLAEFATRADKNDYYYVQVAKKEKGVKEPFIYELFFDKTGNIEQVKTPEGIKEMTVVGIDDPNTETPSAAIDSWQKRFPRAENIVWTKKSAADNSVNYVATFNYRGQDTKAEFMADGTWVETRVELSEKDLYAAVAKYLAENHSDDDVQIAEKVTRADRNDYYYVKLERNEKGQTRPYIFELYFDKSGNIQKENRPSELKSQYLLTVDIPQNVAKKFKSRFSNADGVKWETHEGNWLANFTYRDLPTSAEFTDSAEWVMTIVKTDIKNLYAPIQRYLDSEYKDYKVMYAEKATRQDRNDYYYVELISKKKNLDPQQVGLYFDKTGHLKENK